MDLNLTAFSVPMFSTWVYVHPFRLLIDAGDGAAAILGQKVHSIDTVAVTHAHRDHCAGLLQLLNLRGGHGDLRVVYPSASRSIQALREFAVRFDSVSTGKVTWHPIERRDEVELTLRNCVLRSFPVNHIPEPDRVRSRTLGYHVVEKKMKLRPQMQGLSQEELDRVRLAQGKDAIVEPIEEKVLSASGDTLPLDPAEYRGAQVLLHECTFLTTADRDQGPEEGRDHFHSALPEVLDLAKAAGVGALVLYHISQRYPAAEIAATVTRTLRTEKIDFPVYAVFPGRICRDVLDRRIDEPPGRRRREASGTTAE